jgi:hypothetical protein
VAKEVFIHPPPAFAVTHWATAWAASTATTKENNVRNFVDTDRIVITPFCPAPQSLESDKTKSLRKTHLCADVRKGETHEIVTLLLPWYFDRQA